LGASLTKRLTKSYLFANLLKHRYPMAPDPPRHRKAILDELHDTLTKIGAELEALAPYMSRRTPPVWAVAQQRELLQRSQRTAELLYAMEDADTATMH